jgi:hypothetical protein
VSFFAREFFAADHGAAAVEGEKKCTKEIQFVPYAPVCGK